MFLFPNDAFSLFVLWVGSTARQPFLPVFAHALEGADEKRTGTASGIKQAEFFCARGKGFHAFGFVFGSDFIQQFSGGLLDDVIHDVARGVINATGLADFRLFLNGDAASLRTDDFAEKSFIDAAENFHVNDVEQIGRFVVAQFADEPRQPFVADDKGFREVRLEKIAVEKRDVRGRAAVERAKVADDGTPEGIFGRTDAVATIIGGRFFAQFKRLLMRAASGVFVAGLFAPRLDDALQRRAGVNVAVFANAEKEDAVNDALAGFGELVAFEQFVVVVVFVNVGSEVAPGLVEKFQKIIVERAIAVGLDEPLLAGLARAGGFLGQRIQRLINAAGGDFVAGEQIPKFAGNERVLAEVPAFPFADVRLVNVRLAADDVDFQFLKIGEDGHRHAFVPGIAFGLEGVAGVKFLGGFFGLANETVALVGAEKIIGAFASAADLRGAFNLHFALLLDEAGAIFHVPAERAEEGIEKIVAQLGFGVTGLFEFGEAFAERFDETI